MTTNTHKQGASSSNSVHDEDATDSRNFDTGRKPLPTDSMVSVRLSDSPISPTFDDDHSQPALSIDTAIDSRRVTLIEDNSSSPSMSTPLTMFQEDMEDQQTTLDLEDLSPCLDSEPSSDGPIENETIPASPLSMTQRASDSSSTTHISEEASDNVDWVQLDKHEEEEPRDEGSDESTAFLLARLEQENDAIASDPKARNTKLKEVAGVPDKASRPTSIHQIKKLVNGPQPSSLRYSQLPAPPPMTELEFYAALVTDYSRTAQRLPTLLSKKVRGGIPPPLRGMVWQSMAGARDKLLEEQYDRLATESSPYEGMIGKDIGRSFPGVDMFKDPEGDGQKMLGRVLKCFSLYDHKIGYCQGLGFLVGPLLMHMGDKEAFCVLVRLMEHYNLRSCFLPDLSGLHLRIYQFSKLLTQHLPPLASHLEKLSIEPAYMSQWFLSFFAVTCPLPMLFRIYDVIFAEGASETIMRVALSLMRRNEQKILTCNEFEDVMQLLLSRSLWDVYACNADDLVNDFMSFTGIVTRDGLQALETSFRDSHGSDSPGRTIHMPDFQSAASRFLGRLWSGSNSSTKSANLSPGLAAPSRPTSIVRRSASKQSLTSTLNSVEGCSESGTSAVPTEATTMSREFSADSPAAKSTPISTLPMKRLVSNRDRDLHSQIEDLLTAIGEMQREQAVLVNDLQRAREKDDDDRRAVQTFITKLKSSQLEDNSHLKPDAEDGQSQQSEVTESEAANKSEQLTSLISSMDERFSSTNTRASTIIETKHQLRDELARVREQLSQELLRSQNLERRLSEQESSVSTLRDGLKDARNRLQDSAVTTQKLEQSVRDLRTTNDSSKEARDTLSSLSVSETASQRSSTAGLRELRLGRPSSTRSPTTNTFSKRTSSLSTHAVLATENHTPASAEALLVELVQAKTAEAEAKQEVEELRAKFDSLRKLIGPSASTSSPSAANNSAGHRPSPSQPNIERTATLSAFSSYMSSTTAARTPESAKAAQLAKSQTAASGGGFWSWGKRNVAPATATT
ncbi:MAG: hypothetical protein M1814_003799 [Vezdaea aestivalis]|nr:MAG: hypothetical protein M1814_003799 [Vezdaea aestivalis]